MTATFTLARTSSDAASLARFVAARVDLDACLRLLDVFAAHEVTLVHVLAHVDEVVRLIQTVDVYDLCTELLNDLALWLCI